MISFTAAEIDLVREAFAWWDDFTGLSFTEVTETTDVYGDIRLMKLDFGSDVWELVWGDLDQTAAFAYLPYPTDFLGEIAGDIWIRDDLYHMMFL